MKKLPIFLKTPARVVIAVGLIILVSEFLIMVLIEIAHTAILKDDFLASVVWKFVDPIVLTAIVAPALYLLVFRPLNQQAELERQLDELRRLQNVTAGRELRMKGLVGENTALRNQLSAGPDGVLPVTSGSLEAAPQRATAQSAAQSTEDMQLDTLLFMLEDLERSQHQVEQAHQEWMAALDAVNDPIFLHDKQFRILRCNKAYQQRAGVPFHDLIGQLYYDVFPKTGTPLPCCLRALEKTEEEEDEVAVGDAIYRSRTFSIHDEQGVYLYSVHILENITDSRRAEAALHESEEKFRKIGEAAQDAIIMMADKRISFWNTAAERIFGYTAAEALGQELHALIVPEPARAAFEKAFPHFQTSGDGPVINKMIEVTALRKGGEEFPVELSVSATQFGGQWHAIGIVRDITERKRIESDLGVHRTELEMQNEALRHVQIDLEESRDQFVDLYEFSPVGYLTLSHEEMIDKINLTGATLLGVERNKLLHHRFAPFVATEDRDRWHRHFLDVLQHDGLQRCELALRYGDGSVLHAQLDCLHMKVDGVSSVRIALTDITQRKQAEQALHESEKLYRSLFENMLNGFAYCRMIFEDDQPQDFIYLSVNAAFETLTGLKNVVGKKVSEVIPGIRQSDPGLFENYGRVSLSGKPERFEIYVEALQQWFWISVYSPEKSYFVAVFDVITERKKAEQTLIKSEALLNEMGRLAKVGGWEFNVETREVVWTEEVYRIHELDTTYKPTVDKGIEFYAPASRPIIAKVVQRAIEYGEPYDVELELITAKGNYRWVHTNGKAYQKHGKTITVLGAFRDITERKQAEIAIQHANRVLATLSAVNRSLVYATDENELLQTICQVIVEQRGYQLAWVGYKQHDESKSIKIMARAGHDEGYLDGMQLTWAETEHGMGPSGRAIRSGATQLCQDMVNDPSYMPWRDAALKRGYLANIALPLLNGDNAVFGILKVYAEEANAFTPNEIALLEEMAGDLAFGVRSLRLRQERDLALVKNKEHLVQLAFQNEEKEKRAAELIIANNELAFQNEEKEKRAAELIIANNELHDSLEDTVRAIATIVEMRDPYTSGHQVRVADLASAIATQMGLPDEQVHAIHLAGVVHDLGKIQIPAEILSKPGRISDIEYSLIKIHPQAGYDILKGIDFPWPIAQMVLQHHERMDGSGYPQGLKDGDILLEARILSVADVVEAMSSHRPYRAGLGNDVAMEEITKNRGKFYDPQVVDACLTLFNEQHYSFRSGIA